MSAARIINPILNEFCQLSPSPPVLHGKVACSQQLRRIKRDLFGAADPRDIDKIFDDEMDKHYEQTSKKWDFDFRHGIPLNITNQYDWELVSNQENYLAPQMYTLTRAAHVPLQEWTCITSDLLMDERAERENIIQVTSSSSPSSSDLSDGMHEDDDDVTVLLKLPAITKIHQQEKQQLRRQLQQQQQQQYKQKRPQLQQQEQRLPQPQPLPLPQQQKNPDHQKIHQQQKPIAIITPTCKMQLRKRQPKITEYMKERKRLAQVPKKVTPSKRIRLTMGSGSSAAMTAATGTPLSSPSSSTHNIQTMHNHSISFHFSLRSSQRHN